jgi:hypothetical protein
MAMPTDDRLEFPDIMGATHEYLIKTLADSASKKIAENENNK